MSSEIDTLNTKVTSLKERMEGTKNQFEAICACRRSADMQILIDAISELETRIAALEA